MEQEFTGELIIGLNDHPSLTFNFDTNNFHSQDTEWFLDSINFDGCVSKTCPMSFYQDIIDFCKKQIDKIPHWEVTDGKAKWVGGKDED